MAVSSTTVRKKFLDFFRARGHKIVPSSSLIPDDPSVLLTTAGMQQFKSYYLGGADPVRDFGGRSTVSVQKCFRTSDIEAVGDESHLTFFEMLGNFSFGGYFKEGAISLAYEFLTKAMGFKKSRLSATYLKGDSGALAELKKFLPKNKIKAAGRKDNFWGPTGSEGPCGPTVEFYVEGIEIWNLVFNQYYCQRGGRLRPIEEVGGLKGVDTGMGLERLMAAANNTTDVYQTDLFQAIIGLLPVELDLRTKRILADHLRGIVFLIADGVRPSNKGTGYVLRRLIRRAVVAAGDFNFAVIFSRLTASYDGIYDGLDLAIISGVFNEEQAKFQKTLARGRKELAGLKKINGAAAFKLYESFGLPYEVIKDLGGRKTSKLTREAFDREFKKHQKISRAGLERKFGGHGLLLDTGELKAGDQAEIKKVTRLHTATHLLQQALRDTLGKTIKQMGSDVNADRTRFDFSFERKLDHKEIRRAEQIVNQKIKADLPVNFQELPLEEAKKTGALFYFKEKYPARVKVYYIGQSLKSAYSKEFCGGPHVSRTGEIGKFKIVKEESIGAGVRRIRGAVD